MRMRKNILLLQAESNYLGKRISYFQKFKTSYPKIQEQVNEKLVDDELKKNQNINKQEELLLSMLEKNKQKQLDILKKAYDEESLSLKIEYENRKITKEQYDARLIMLEYNTSYARMEVSKARASYYTSCNY